ncbi:MAG: zeta toxin family protein [Pyrinomonadaceae bacterium]
MPNLYVIGGANGAGKTTTAIKLLPDFLACNEYVNADAIAAGLSPFRPQSVALQAGRLMIERVHSLAKSNQDFAFETTLASRSFVPFLRQCRSGGYGVHVIYLWLQTVELAVERVRRRVASGGHDIAETVIRRRYEAGRRNFVELYLPLADTWQAFDNSAQSYLPIAAGGSNLPTTINDQQVWQSIIGLR